MYEYSTSTNGSGTVSDGLFLCNVASYSLCRQSTFKFNDKEVQFKPIGVCGGCGRLTVDRPPWQRWHGRTSDHFNLSRGRRVLHSDSTSTTVIAVLKY